MDPEKTSIEANAALDHVVAQAAKYWNDVHMSSRSQYKAGDINATKGNRFGWPVVALTTLVGTSIFAQLSGYEHLILQIVTGFLSLAAAVLSALQTFFNYSEKADNHRMAGANYAALRRELDIFILKYGDGNWNSEQAVDDLKKLTVKMAERAGESPRIPDAAWNTAVAEQKAEAEAGKQQEPPYTSRTSKIEQVD